MKTILFISTLALFLTAQVVLAKTVVVAVDAQSGASIYASELITSKKNTRSFVDSENLRIDLAPYSVAEFNEKGVLKLLRGSAYVDSKKERIVTTASSTVEFVGKVLLSYDYKEKSSSSFVISGQARMLNPHQNDQSVLLDKNQGATMVIGDVYPSTVRGLNYQKTTEWLAGYGWNEEQRQGFLKNFPVAGKAGSSGKVSRGPALEMDSPEKLAARESDPAPDPEAALISGNTQLQDYFSAIEKGDEKPHYYEDKLSMDVTVGEALAANKNKQSSLDPEDAALIPLPSVRIDTQLPQLMIVSAEEKKHYEEQEFIPVKTAKKEVNRKLASIPSAESKKSKFAVAAGNDPDIAAVLERLHKLQQAEASTSKPQSSRSPASFSSPIPDPVYDFSENF